MKAGMKAKLNRSSNIMGKKYKIPMMISMALIGTVVTNAAQAIAAEGGSGAGNGGGGVFCHVKGGPYMVGQALDLYEYSSKNPAAREEDRLTYPVGLTYDELIKEALKRIAQGDGADDIKNELEYVQKQIADPKSDVPSGYEILYPHEVFPAVKPNGCEFLPVISYLPSGKLMVNRWLRNILEKSDLDRAANDLHEAVYRVMRDYHAVDDSVIVRQIVAHAFATNYDRKLLTDLTINYFAPQLAKDPKNIRMRIDHVSRDDHRPVQLAFSFDYYRQTQLEDGYGEVGGPCRIYGYLRNKYGVNLGSTEVITIAGKEKPGFRDPMTARFTIKNVTPESIKRDGLDAEFYISCLDSDRKNAKEQFRQGFAIAALEGTRNLSVPQVGWSPFSVHGKGTVQIKVR